MTMIPFAGAERRKPLAKAAPKPPLPKLPKRKGGFALLDPDRLREISIKGGKVGGPKAPKEKRMFFVDRALALKAASKGNAASHAAKAAKKREQGT